MQCRHSILLMVYLTSGIVAVLVNGQVMGKRFDEEDEEPSPDKILKVSSLLLLHATLLA